MSWIITDCQNLTFNRRRAKSKYIHHMLFHQFTRRANDYSQKHILGNRQRLLSSVSKKGNISQAKNLLLSTKCVTHKAQSICVCSLLCQLFTIFTNVFFAPTQVTICRRDLERFPSPKRDWAQQHLFTKSSKYETHFWYVNHKGSFKMANFYGISMVTFAVCQVYYTSHEYTSTSILCI